MISMFDKLLIYQLMKIFKFLDDHSFITFLRVNRSTNKLYTLKFLTNEYKFNEIYNKNKYLFKKILIDILPKTSVKIHYTKQIPLQYHSKHKVSYASEQYIPVIKLPETTTHLKIGIYNGIITNTYNLRYIVLGYHYTNFNFANRLYSENITCKIFNENIACELIANFILSPLIQYNLVCKNKRKYNNHFSGFSIMKEMAMDLMNSLNKKRMCIFLNTYFVKNISVKKMLYKNYVFDKYYDIYMNNKYSNILLNNFVQCIKKILQYIVWKVNQIKPNKYVTFNSKNIVKIKNY